MEEKRVYCCLARRIQSPTYFFALKKCVRDLVQQVSHFYEKSPRMYSQSK